MPHNNSPQLRALVESLFQPSHPENPDGSMGAELELIPFRDHSHQRVLIDASGEGPGSADIIRDAGTTHGWREETDSYGAPSWATPDGGHIFYEPGGQIEISSPVFQSAAELERFLREVVRSIRDSARAAEVVFLSSGIDPYNSLDAVPLQLHAPRYEAMTRYFDSIGASGARMMRQTASLQVSVELGSRPFERWKLLNSLAPYLVAEYANSPAYEGRATGYASYRARSWQTLDSTRTGLPFDANDPIGAYARFAEHAGRIVDDDAAHLTTLFPEIRPRGYFEIRSMDSMEPDRVGEALQFISRLVHDEDVAAEAQEIVGNPDASLLPRAAEFARSDPAIDAPLKVLDILAAD
jgi:glutamate--cysteine ligase